MTDDAERKSRLEAARARLESDLVYIVEAGDRISHAGAETAREARDTLHITGAAHGSLDALASSSVSSDCTCVAIVESGSVNLETMAKVVSEWRVEIEAVDAQLDSGEAGRASVLPIETRTAITLGKAASEILDDVDPGNPAAKHLAEFQYPENREIVALKLATTDRDLAAMLVGIENALSVDQPDRVRRASQPARDLITLLLNCLAPHKSVCDAEWFKQESGTKGQATRYQRIQYAVYGATHKDLDDRIKDAVAMTAEQLVSLYSDLSGSSHTGVGDVARIRSWYQRLLEHVRSVFELREAVQTCRGLGELV